MRDKPSRSTSPVTSQTWLIPVLAGPVPASGQLAGLALAMARRIDAPFSAWRRRPPAPAAGAGQRRATLTAADLGGDAMPVWQQTALLALVALAVAAGLLASWLGPLT